MKPDESLMLLKPLAEVPHEGRQALKPDSREHQLLRDWIAQGTKGEELKAGRATSIEILPGDVEMDLPGRDQQMLVIAKYPDGTTRDVTRDAHFSVSNTEVAKAGGDGVVKGLRRGEAAILIRYEGIYGTRLLTIMGDRSGYEWKEVAENNFIDKHVNDKLRRMKALPSRALHRRRIHPPRLARSHRSAAEIGPRAGLPCGHDTVERKTRETHR